MKRWIDTRRIRLLPFAIFVAVFFWAALFSGSSEIESGSFGDSLILNVYIDSTGKALVTGYVDNISGIDFLATSQYSFENDTRQLYALTDSLTTKSGDIWTLRFDARGIFDDYRITFYLPGDMSLGMINVSSDLEYHFSASNESLVADVRGYELSDPSVSIQYQQPLAAGPPFPPGNPFGYPGVNINLILLLIGIFLLATGSTLTVVFWRHREKSAQILSPLKTDEQDRQDLLSYLSPASVSPLPQDESGGPEQSQVDSQADISAGIPGDCVGSSLESQAEDGSDNNHIALAQDLPPSPKDDAYAPEHSQAGPGEIDPSIRPNLHTFASSRARDSPDSPALEAKTRTGSNSGSIEQRMGSTSSIELSREMQAVIQTLTTREQAVVKTLVDHGGRMTQAEIRYETRTPKSSLTGILISLERRKLITKKEWGRTNIIELSEWFLSQREHS